MDVYEQLPGALLPWYRAHKRALPWRNDREPYHIWLSEIMLQQTRVEAVKGYYTRFLDALPTIAALAACDDDRLHKLWEGLGYYSRVRNLKRAANVVMTRHGGVFPTSYPEVLALPGIGAYTAGAICSIAYDLPTPAVDGNVLRVAARLTREETPIDRPECRERIRAGLARVYPPQAGEFTQALMELGATVCGPNRVPDCECCPCRGFCGGYLSGTAAQYPVKSPKKPRKIQEKTVFILSCGELYALEKRPDTGLLASLWQFPNQEGFLSPSQAVQAVQAMGLHPTQVLRQAERSHIFTHIQWRMRGYYLEVRAPEGGFVWLPAEAIRAQAALPTAFRQFFREENHV